MNLRRNSIFSAAEVVVSGVCLFLIYRNVVQTLGVSMLGVWSLVLATTAFGRAADLGIAGGLSRFIARSLAEEAPERAVLYMRTGVMFMALTMAAVALALWGPLWWSLDFALSGAELSSARSILPWAVLSLWLLIVKAALDSCLLGMHRADLRAVAGISGTLFQLVGSLALVGAFGLHGLAWAQAGQFALAIILELLFLYSVTRTTMNGVRTRGLFSTKLLKEMLGFGLKIQAGSLANLMFEPAVKTILGAVAGTHVLGIFEMAYRMTYQVRNVAIMGMQPTVPAFATLTVHGGTELSDLFRRVCKQAAVSSAILMSAVAITSPVISWLYLGSVNPLFVYVSGTMGIMWSATILAAPAYYLGIASGRVAPYITGEVVALLTAAVSVFALGNLCGPEIAVLGVALGKVLGSIITASLIRPGRDWQTSAAANPTILISMASITAVCSLIAGAALSQI